MTAAAPALAIRRDYDRAASIEAAIRTRLPGRGYYYARLNVSF